MKKDWLHDTTVTKLHETLNTVHCYTLISQLVQQITYLNMVFSHSKQKRERQHVTKKVTHACKSRAKLNVYFAIALLFYVFKCQLLQHNPNAFFPPKKVNHYWWITWRSNNLPQYWSILDLRSRRERDTACYWVILPLQTAS